VSGKTILGFSDVHFTPLYAGDLVNAIMELISFQASGLFHVVGDERISKFDFGTLVAEVFGLPAAHLKQGKMGGMKGAEIRSHDLSLSNDKFKSLGVNLPSVREGLLTLKENIL
jgi:dTDP-4-dehydrorhamnose reductase